ncbi:hypothetical protein F4818DRAFT_446357 [Hypoxylon cercidicola]|nr:hypothetical protein F4818DRAFT_446357 [Hypoxylon cercidicola]
MNNSTVFPMTPLAPYPEDVSPIAAQPALFRTEIGSSPYHNGLIACSNERQLNSRPAGAAYNQQSQASNEPYRSSGQRIWAGTLQTPTGLLFQTLPQTQPWANSQPMGIGVPSLSRDTYLQQTRNSNGDFRPSPALNPDLSHGYEPRGSSHRNNIQSYSPETTSFPQQNPSALAPLHEVSQIPSSLYLANLIEKEIQLTMTRADGSKVKVAAKPTCEIENMYITRRKATQLALKIRPIAQPKRRECLTPNGREIPVGFVAFHIESEDCDIHRTHVSAMVLEDSSNNLTAICLGIKFLQKAYASKLKRDWLSKRIIDTNNTAPYTVPQVSDSRMGNKPGRNDLPTDRAHHQYATSQDMGRLATAVGPIHSSATSPISTNTQSYLHPSTMSHSAGPPYSGYPSTMPSGPFSELPTTSWVTAPSSVEDDINSPNPLGQSSNNTIDPHLLTFDNGLSIDESFSTAPQQAPLGNQTPMPGSGQNGLYYSSHLQSDTTVPYYV